MYQKEKQPKKENKVLLFFSGESFGWEIAGDVRFSLDGSLEETSIHFMSIDAQQILESVCGGGRC